MNTLYYILEKYKIDLKLPSPVQLQWTRDDLAKLFGEVGFKLGAEIGVDRGFYSKTLCEAIPGLGLYCIDPWKVYRKYDDIKDPKRMEINYNETVRRLAPYNCVLIRKSSMNAIKDFQPGSLDFVYVDGNHAYNYVLEDLEGWSKIVRSGGIVSGHDYTLYKHVNVGLEVKRAVDQHIKDHDIKLFFWLKKQRSSTWFYVKE
jgi:hypothetical protein